MILSVGIGGEWTARNLAAVLDNLESLAGFLETGRVITMTRQIPEISGTPAGIVIETTDDFPSLLKVVSLNYNSPGSIDLLGVAKIIEQLRLFLEFLINLYVLRNDRELDLEERKVELASKRAEVLAKISEVHPHFVPFVEKEAADALIQAVFEGRITAVTTKDSDTE
jgi:hypothetical protein